MIRRKLLTLLFLAVASLLPQTNVARQQPVVTVGAPVVGTLAGTFGVDGNGAATYEIPIDVPPGTAGVQPELQLTYNSQRDNGSIGMGWALNGIDAISRCNATPVTDGFIAGVAFTLNDRYCIGASTLHAVRGTYGSDGTEYRTTRDTWTRFVSHGRCGEGPCWFSAQNKDGATLRFGFTTGAAGSRVLASGRSDGAVRVWSFDRYVDRNGNYTEVVYENAPLTGEYQPVQIRYTGNERTGLAPQRAIKLEYERRPDPISGSVGGSGYLTLNRLAAIETSVGTTVVKRYAIVYTTGTATGRSRVSSIQECGRAGQPERCYPPTVFTSSDPPLGMTGAPSVSTGRAVTTLLSMDVDGDGRVDLVQPTGTAGSALGVVVYRGSLAGLDTGRAQDLGATTGGLGIFGADVNSDGLGDLVMPVNERGALTLHAFVSDGTRFGPAVKTRTSRSATQLQILPLDANGDGREDVVQVVDEGGKITYALMLAKGDGTFEPAQLTRTSRAVANLGFLPMDVNRDGRADMVQPQLSGGRLQLLVEYSAGGTFVPGPSFDTGRTPVEPHMHGGDFDGDHVGDLLLVEKQGAQLLATPYLGTGTGFEGVTSFRLDGGTANRGVYTANFNGDGRTDVLQQLEQNGRIRLVPFLSTGTNFRRGEAIDTDRSASVVGLTLLELNGDGKQDAVMPRDVNGRLQLDVLLNRPGEPDLLTSVTTGIGGRTEVVQQPLLTGELYERGRGAVYPARDVALPMPVVAAYTNYDGRGAAYRFEYRYEQARVGVNGIGWLGFATVRMTEAASRRVSLVRYDQEWPHNGLVTRTDVRARDFITIARTESDYRDIASESLRALGIHQFVPVAERYTAFDEGGATLYTLEKRYSYDAFGNLAMLSDLGRPAVPSDARYTCYRYANDPMAWVYGYLEQEKTTRTEIACRAFLTAATPAWDPQNDYRWSRRAYDARMNIASDSQWDDSHNAWLTTTYESDDYGNRTSIDEPARGRWTIEFDAAYHTFPVTSTSPPNAVGTRLVSRMDSSPYYGSVIREVDPNGNTIRAQVDALGRVTDEFELDPDRGEKRVRHTAWARDANGTYTEESVRPRWDSADDPSTWLWHRTYTDALGRDYREERRGTTPERNVITEVEYNAKGQAWRTSVPRFPAQAPQWIETDYDLYNRPVRTTDPDKTVTEVRWDLGSLKYTRTSAAGTPDARSDVETFNVFGLVTSRISPMEESFRYTYTPMGEIETVYSLLDRRTYSFTYDSLGRTRSSTGSNSGTTRFDFDAKGLLSGTTDADGNSVTFAYDALGRLRRSTQNTSAGEQVIDYTWDGPTSNGLGNLTRVSTSQAPVGTFTYDFGFDPAANTTSIRLTIGKNVYSSAATYTPDGDTLTDQYPDGTKAFTSYGPNGLPTTIDLQTPGGARETYVTHSDYSPDGVPLSVVYRNGLAMKRVFYPDDVALGRLKTLTATAGDRTLYSRQLKWNRLALVTDVVDLLATPGHTQSFKYDRANTGMLERADGSYGSKTFGYDALGNRRKASGVDYTYQPGTDRLAAFGPGTGATWNGNGTLKTLTRGGQTFRFTYDAEQHLVKAERDGATPLVRVHDFAGVLLYEQRLGETAKTWHVTPAFEVVDYGRGKNLQTKYVNGVFGPVAAITTNAGTAASISATARNNREIRASLYAQSDQWLYRTRAWGDRVLGFISSRQLDLWLARAQLGMLCAALLVMLGWLAGRCRSSYASRHPLFASCTPALVIALVIYVAPPLHAQLVPGVNGPGMPVLGTVYFFQDALGNTMAVTDESAATVAQVEYLPFGGVDQAASSGVDVFRPKYAGKPLEPGTGLYDFGMRDYDPATGRFTTPDPARQYFNPYLYAGNSPESFVDPNGEWAFLVVILIGAVVGAYLGAAAVNHDYNPINWDWRSGKTYAGLLGGAVIGAVGGAIIEVAASAGVVAGIAGAILVGAGENAAFTAMGGGSAKDILISAAEGAAFGLLLGGAGAAVGRIASRFARRGATVAEGAASGETRALRTVAESCAASFAAGEEIVLADGTLQPIETIVLRQKVRAFDEQSQRRGEFDVIGTIVSETGAITRVTTASGTGIDATPGHLFRTFRLGWLPADQLAPGIALMNADGEPVEIHSVATHALGSPQRVYNVAVDRAGNYYLSAERILVKNVFPGCVMGLVPKMFAGKPLKKFLNLAKGVRQKVLDANRIRSGPDAGKIRSLSGAAVEEGATYVTKKGAVEKVLTVEHIAPKRAIVQAAADSIDVVTPSRLKKSINHLPNLRPLEKWLNNAHVFEPGPKLAKQWAEDVVRKATGMRFPKKRP